MLFSYHVHSNMSDGDSEIPEMIRAAAGAGLDEVGISDHCIITPDRAEMCWAMGPDAVEDYAATVQASAGEAPEGLVVRLGIEMDFVPQTVRETAELLASQPFDYVIGSVHSVDGFLVDENEEGWAGLDQSQRNEVIRTYWALVKGMAESGLFDFVGHIDLPKKFGVYASVDLTAEIGAALDAIARAGMPVELNTAGWYWTCEECYPSPTILAECRRRGIPVLVSADAHMPANIARGFDRAFGLLREVGYTELTSFSGRAQIVRPLP
ncbi:MAG: histidinol-phosphatase HisJ family protein [Armatimonadota bacterium]